MVLSLDNVYNWSPEWGIRKYDLKKYIYVRNKEPPFKKVKNVERMVEVCPTGIPT